MASTVFEVIAFTLFFFSVKIVDGGTQRISILKEPQGRQLLEIQSEEMRNPKLGGLTIVFGAMMGSMK